VPPPHGVWVTEARFSVGDCTMDVITVDGGWTDWTDWSSCSVSCGDGERIRTRNCSNPTPLDGGADCTGNNTDWQSCHQQGCTGKHFIGESELCIMNNHVMCIFNVVIVSRFRQIECVRRVTTNCCIEEIDTIPHIVQLT